MSEQTTTEHEPNWTAYRQAGHTVEETARHFGVDPKTVAERTPAGIHARRIAPKKRGSSNRPNGDIAREFGLRVRLLRESHGISQREMAERAGIPEPSVLSRYEDGSRVPNLIDAFNLAQALGVSLNLLCQPASRVNE